MLISYGHACTCFQAHFTTFYITDLEILTKIILTVHELNTVFLFFFLNFPVQYLEDGQQFWFTTSFSTTFNMCILRVCGYTCSIIHSYADPADKTDTPTRHHVNSWQQWCRPIILSDQLWCNALSATRHNTIQSVHTMGPIRQAPSQCLQKFTLYIN